MKPLWFPARRAAALAAATIVAFALSPIAAPGSQDTDVARQFVARAETPIAYVLSKFADHRVVCLGEAHWIRHDVKLVADLVPRLAERGVTAIAIEMFRESDQAILDGAVKAPEWKPGLVMGVMRNAEWPYREYLEIVHEAWKANRGGASLRVLAVGPASDWRETLLPKGQTYDTFMAQKVAEHLAEVPKSRVLLYAGLNHVFTRYHQPEMPRETRVEAFFDRAGNLLWRRFGEDVVSLILHHPWRFRLEGKIVRRVPANGAIDCSAASSRRAVGFDLGSSPFGPSKLQGFEYALGYPDLRLMDMADGYIWQAPIGDYSSVALIPLAEYAPDDAALAFVSQHSPFADTKGSTRAELERQWNEQAAWLRDAQTTRGWAGAAPSCR